MPRTKAQKGTVTKHFVIFVSPGTFFSETTKLPIASWDVEKACEMSKSIKERYGATPYGFRFVTYSRGPNDLDSRAVKKSPMYYLGGTVRTLAEVERDNKPDEEILRSNMRINGYDRIIENNNSYRATLPLEKGDVVLEWPKASKRKGK